MRLIEAIAACALDGVTITVRPDDPDGTGLPVGVIVGARKTFDDGTAVGNCATVGFDELESVSRAAADGVLAAAVDDVQTPIRLAAGAWKPRPAGVA